MRTNITITLLLLSVITFAQQGVENLTLENIYKRGLIRTEGIRQVKWLDGGQAYSVIEKGEIVKYNSKTGNRSILVSKEQLTPQGIEKPLPVSNYSYSDDKSKLLIFTNTRRVWRYHTRGDYWVLDIKSGNLKHIGKDKSEASLMFAKFSPDGTKVAYVSKNNIYNEDLETGEVKSLTVDGCEHIVNGTFDWVYEEEFGCRDGFRWSSDSKYIAYWQSNTEGTGTFYMVNNLDSVYAEIIPLPYPKAGTTNSAVKIGVVDINSQETKWIELPGDPRNNYIPRMEFVPEKNELLVQQMNRLQNTNKVWSIPVETCQAQNIFTEQNNSWLETNDDIKWLENGKYFTWMSDRSGCMHLYKVSADGKEILPITEGEFEVESVQCIDEKSNAVYFIAAPNREYTQRALFKENLKGKKKAIQLSPSSKSGHHRYNISPNGKWAIHTFGNVTTPNQIAMLSLPSHEQTRVFKDNEEAKKQYDDLTLNPKEFIKLDIGDIVLDAWMIKPADFDETKKYPVIFHVYGEPAGSTVQNRWEGGDLWHQYMANQGYIVMSIENRGANVPRGKKWRKSIYGEVGVLSSQDQYNGALKVLETYPFIDRERVGIWGWSGGGSMTLNCMFRYPDLYKTGIAVAFVADQKLYDTIYQERYMGTPQSNEEGYKKASPIHHAEGLKGNLMLIHGTGDDNVHYQNCEILVDKLIKLDKMFSMMSYPMRAHGIYERENTSLHLRRVMEKYWKENL